MPTGDAVIQTRLVSDADDLRSAYGTVVVGAGLSGLELARELEARGAEDVLVLEAGQADELRHVNSAHDPERSLRMWLEPATDNAFDRPWLVGNPPHYSGSAGLRRRIGGRSLYWHGVCLPVEPWALRSPWWPQIVVDDLRHGWRGGPALYDRLGERLTRWRGGSSVADSVDSANLGGATLQVTPSMVRRCESDPDRWYAYSPLDAWRDPETGVVHSTPRGIRIVPGVEVLSVDVHSGRCRGVVVRHRDAVVRSIRADTVVLAAGTLEATRLAVQALFSLGALEQPRMGGLSDHLVQGFFVRVPAGRADRLREEFGDRNFYAAHGLRSLLFFEQVDLPNGDLLADVRLSGEQLPSAGSFVECHPGGAFPWPCAAHGALSTADWEVVRSQRESLQQILEDLLERTGGDVAKLDFGDFDAPPRTNAEVLPERVAAMRSGDPVTWSSYLGFEDHEGGTLPLGTTLNERQEFSAISGLYALGPATFPRAGAANPAFTTLALAHRLAAELC